MYDLSRRRFVVSAATAAAAFGLDKQLEFIPSALAQKAGSGSGAKAAKASLTETGFYKFKVGDVEVTQLYDGIWEKPHDASYIKNASIDDTKKALLAAKLTDAHVPIMFTITVIKSKGKTTMFDSGTGAQLMPTAGLIVKKEQLKAAGIDPAAISTIIMTHFHPDHIFGLMAKDTNAQVFPDAEILVPAAEYKYWTDPDLLPKLPEARQGLAKRIQATFPTWKNVRQVEDDKEVAPGIRSVNSNGHTPGHTSYLVSSGRRQLLVLGDVAVIPALFVRNPGWQGSFDTDAVVAEASRRRLFDRAIADKIIIAGYHFGMPGAGTVTKDGGGYVFKPVA